MQSRILKVTTPAPRDVWLHLFEADLEAVPYQSPQWLDAICASGTYEDASRLYDLVGGQQVVLPMVKRTRLGVTTAGSMPSGWGMGGILTAQRGRIADMAAAFDDLARLPFAHITIRPNPRVGALWAAAAPATVKTEPRRAHVLDLTGGFGQVWSTRFAKATRSRVRHAERAGVVVERDTSGRLVPVFHALLRQSIERWAAQQREPLMLAHWRARRRDPLEKFQAIARMLGDAAQVWVAWVGGEPAAASLVLRYGNVNDARNAMNKELAASTGANDLLLKMSIEDACDAGCRYYHLGESGASKGLADFKERFGAVAYPYAEYYFDRLPVRRLDRLLRVSVKKLVGFRDVSAT
jgi:hypothetical protein